MITLQQIAAKSSIRGPMVVLLLTPFRLLCPRSRQFSVRLALLEVHHLLGLLPFLQLPGLLSVPSQLLQRIRQTLALLINSAGSGTCCRAGRSTTGT